MDEDKQGAKDLRDREQELSAGARALTRRLRQLEARGAELQPEIASLHARQDAGEDVFEDQLTLLDKVAELDEDKRACLWGLYILTADAIGTEHTAADVQSWCQRAVDMGARHPRIGHALLGHLLHVRKVPNAPFRERALQLTAHNGSLKRGEVAGGIRSARNLHHGQDEGYEGSHQKGNVVMVARELVQSPPISTDSRFGTVQFAALVGLVHKHLREIEGERGENYGSANLMHDSCPQPRVLERLLGMRATSYGGEQKPSLCLFISYELALALARAFDMTPHASGT